MLWLFLGIIIGAGLYWLIMQTKANKLEIKWYQWILGALAVITFLLTVENYLGFKKELEPVAANFVLIAMGLPAVILALLAWAAPKIKGIVGSKGKDSKVTG